MSKLGPVVIRWFGGALSMIQAGSVFVGDRGMLRYVKTVWVGGVIGGSVSLA